MRPRYCCWTLTLLCLMVVNAQDLEQSVLSLPIFPASLTRERIPLSRALGDLGSYVRDGYVLFGLELRAKDGHEPVVSIDLRPGSTLGDGIHQLLAQLPGYRYEVISAHLINIYPKGSKEDANDILNTRVHRFDVTNVDPSQILSDPKDFIPELASRLTLRQGPPKPAGSAGDIMGGSGPRISLHLHDTTLRQILNAVSNATDNFPPEQQPLGWLYSFKEDPSLPMGGAHAWTFLWSAPANWKQSPTRPN